MTTNQHPKKLVLLGAGGTTVDVLSIIADINCVSPAYQCIGLLDDNPEFRGKTRHGIKVLGPIEHGASIEDVSFVDCMGGPDSYWKRPQILKRLGVRQERFETLVHPRASVSGNCRIGRGVVLYPNVVVMANVSIGDHVTVLANTVMNHDVSIGDLSILTSGVNVSGRVNIGRNCYIGTGSTLKQGIRIGELALIGMGSVVLHDVPDRGVVAGNPATLLRTIEPAP